MSASVSAPARDASKLVNASTTTSPSSTENPVARTPNTPDARSPSWKWLPSGADRRTMSITAIAAAVQVTTMSVAQTRSHLRVRGLTGPAIARRSSRIG